MIQERVIDIMSVILNEIMKETSEHMIDTEIEMIEIIKIEVMITDPEVIM